jgi:hypothetical protein
MEKNETICSVSVAYAIVLTNNIRPPLVSGGRDMSVSPYHACECTHEFTTWLTTRSFPSTATPGHRLLIPFLLGNPIYYLLRASTALVLTNSVVRESFVYLCCLYRRYLVGPAATSCARFRGLPEGLRKATTCEFYCLLYSA